MLDDERFWAETIDMPPGVTEEQIGDWERRYGVVLPRLLRGVLARQDGGYYRYAPILVRALDEIRPKSAEFWEWAEPHVEVTEDTRAFDFAEACSGPYGFLFHYNAQRPAGEPGVWAYVRGEAVVYDGADSLEEFFAQAIRWSNAPEQDWHKAQAEADILARETVEVAALDQILARRKRFLFLYTREQGPRGTALTVTAIPLPLDAQATEIRPARPAPAPTFVLRLRPEVADEMDRAESTQFPDGRWAVSESLGVPHDVGIESADRARLESLRARLINCEII